MPGPGRAGEFSTLFQLFVDGHASQEDSPVRRVLEVQAGDLAQGHGALARRPARPEPHPTHLRTAAPIRLPNATRPVPPTPTACASGAEDG